MADKKKRTRKAKEEKPEKPLMTFRAFSSKIEGLMEKRVADKDTHHHKAIVLQVLLNADGDVDFDTLLSRVEKTGRYGKVAKDKKKLTLYLKDDLKKLEAAGMVKSQAAAA